MSLLARIVAGRRSKFAVLGAWIAVAVALGPLAARFEAAQRNEPSSFLPGDAESVLVLEAGAGFEAGEVAPAVVVFRDPDGLGDAGRAGVMQAAQRVDDAGIEGVGPLSPPRYSRDGTAAVVTVPIAAEGDEELLIGAVADVRERV